MKKYLFLFFALVLGIDLFASPLQNVVPTLSTEQMTNIQNGELLVTSSYEGDVWSLIPQKSQIIPQIETTLGYEKGFTLVISTLVPYPEGWETLDNEEKMLEMVNKAFETTTMDGMTFCPKLDSSKTKVLFRKSSLLGSPNKKDRIPNAHFEELPEHLEYYIYQEDTNYGDNIYHGYYDITPEEFSITLTNHNALSVAGVPVVAAGKISIGMDMSQTDEGIYICGFASVKDKAPVFNVLGIKIDVAESVLTRVIALKDWYISRLSK